MADSTSNNIQTVVMQVDVGSSINSLKDYKQYLESLKVALLKLEEGSEEYNKIAKDLRDGQEKLNGVLAVSKDRSDAVEGSYDSLSQTMSKLKREWKATGDVARRAELATQILDINNQLKDMDASVGVFSRNVGDYANAFEDAFKNVLGELGQVDGGLGDLAKTTNQLIPLIKKTTQVATAGLSGIKKAIAATGIGLLIVAVGTLVSNFDALRKAVGVTDEQFQGFKTKATGVLEKVGAGVTGVGNVILQFLIRPIKETIALVKGLAQIFGRVLQPIKTFIQALVDRQGIKGAFTALKDAAKGMFTDISDTLKKTGGEIKDIYLQSFDIKGNFKKGQEVGQNIIKNIKEGVKKEGPVTVEVQPKVDEVSPIKERLSWFGLTDEQTLKKQFDERTKAINEQYEKEKDILEKAGEDTSKLTAEWIKNRYDAETEYNNALQEIYDKREQAQVDSLLEEQLAVELGLDGILDAEESANLARLMAQQAFLDEQKAKEEAALRERVSYYVDYAGSLSSILGSVSDAWQDTVEAQIEAGEISEEEGKKQFEKIKALQIAEAIINTIAGAVGALMGITKSTGGWGIAAAVAQAAAITAAGFAQVKKIQNTKIGSNNIDGGVPEINRISDDYMPSYTQTVTNQTDIDALSNALATNMKSVNLSVSVSEIDAVQNRVKTREVESSF